MLQAFAHQGGSAGGGAEQETLGACVGRRPGEIAHPLQPEHGVEDIERDRRDIVVAVGGASGDPGRYRTGFVDAFLQNLAVFGLFIVAELPGVLRGIQLAEPEWMPIWRNRPSMPNVRDSSGTMGTISLPMLTSLSSVPRILTKAMVVDMLRSPLPFRRPSKRDSSGIASGADWPKRAGM